MAAEDFFDFVIVDEIFRCDNALDTKINSVLDHHDSPHIQIFFIQSILFWALKWVDEVENFQKNCGVSQVRANIVNLNIWVTF